MRLAAAADRIGYFSKVGLFPTSHPWLRPPAAERHFRKFCYRPTLYVTVLCCRHCRVLCWCLLLLQVSMTAITYLLAYLLAYSMVQSPSLEANRMSASQEIPLILWNPKVHYRIHKCLPPALILSQIDPIHTPPHSTSWRPTLILSSHLRLGLPSGLFPSGFPSKALCTSRLSPILATCKYDTCCLLCDYYCYIGGSVVERHLPQPHCTQLYKSVNIYFFPNASTCPCGLRGLPSWVWQKCNRLLRLGRPWGAVTLSRWCEWWYRRM